MSLETSPPPVSCAGAPSTATHDELVASARQLAPTLAARAATTESCRTLLPETVEQIGATGITLSLTPRRWSGYELGFRTLADTTVELARGCASTAWCTMFVSTHQWALCHFDEEAQAEALGPDPGVRIAAMAAPLGHARRVKGGYRLSGAWPWASLIDHATWFMAGAFVAGDDPPHLHFFLVDRSQFSWKDTWRHAGLSGTGSHTAVVDDAFVPAHRVIGFERMSEGVGPGVESNPAAFYRAPFAAVSATVLAMVALGAARGAYDHFCEWTRGRTSGTTGMSVPERASVQLEVTRAAAEIDAAQMLLDRCVDCCDDPGGVDYAIRVRCRRDQNVAVQLLVGAVDRLMSVGAARAMAQASPMQRAWRDVHAVSGHILFNFDGVAERFGRMELGLEPPPPQRDPYY
jgi:3-hydroxy-9,10-secoandrosta-1,3,5(10)-triene-9,17-dione monooxygenase